MSLVFERLILFPAMTESLLHCPLKVWEAVPFLSTDLFTESLIATGKGS